MKKISTLIISISLLLLPVLSLASVPVYADATSDAKAAVDPAGTSAGAPAVNTVIAHGISLFALIIGVVAVIMIMVGGLKFITAQGDANQVASARNTVLYAVVGLVVAALAQVIVKFVLVKV